MDIYLSECSDKKAGFTFPSLPERIRVSCQARYQTYDMINSGTVRIPKGKDCGEISWSSVFYGASKRKEPMMRSWTPPSECKSILNDWMSNNTKLRLLVTETNINCDVTISSFQYEEYGAYGNTEYSIVFVPWKDLTIYTTKEKGASSKNKKTKPRSAPSRKKNYTVKSGDNLWKIARKFYGGSGADWKKIYDANKSVIETAARNHGRKSSDNGWWIYPGTSLFIP